MTVDEREGEQRAPFGGRRPGPAPSVGPRADLRSKHVQLVIAAGFGVLIAVFIRVVFGEKNLLVILGGGYIAFVVVAALSGVGRRVEASPPAGPSPLVQAPRRPLPPDEFAPHREITADAIAPFEADLIGPAAARFEESLPDDPALDQPLLRRSLSTDDLIDAGIALAAALAAVFVLRAVLAWNDLIGPALWTYGFFLAFLYLLNRDRIGPETGFDRLVTFAIWSAGAILLALLIWMIVFLVGRGAPRLKTSFFTQDMATAGPLSPGGGVKHAIIGTLEQVGIATAFTVPLSVLTAVYLNEMKGRLSWVLRFIVDAMSGLPSIVAGLLVVTLWVDGHGYSGVAGSAALFVLMLPTVTRASEEILRTVPDSLREASLALGAPQWRVVLRVVLPTAAAGLVTAVILGIARAAGETAPMLYTSFTTDQTNTNPFHGPQADLPTFVWQLIRQPNKAQNDRAWAGLLVLVMLVIVLFTTARYISGRSQRKLRRAR